MFLLIKQNADNFYDNFADRRVPVPFFNGQQTRDTVMQYLLAGFIHLRLLPLYTTWAGL